jgi:serine/threonine protein kinase
MLEPNAFVQNRYLFVRRLGGGETSAVYEAIDMNTRANVALKQVIVGADAAGGRREILKREARRLAGLRHPALPVVSDAFVEGDSVFMAAEFVPGDDLMTVLERNGRPFPIVQALRWADQLLDALDYLHTQLPPVLHRDITPRNLKLTPRGQVMLLDHGLVWSEVAPVQVKPTSPGLPSPFQFMPPEQVARAGMTIRSDLFSLAATLYFLLTGTPPVLAGKRANAIARGQPDPLRPARELIPDLPAAVSDLLTRALSLDPAARPASAADMRAALDRARVGPLVLPDLPSQRPSEPAPAIPSPAPGARPSEAPTLLAVPPRIDAPGATLPSPPQPRQRNPDPSTLRLRSGQASSGETGRRGWLAPAIGVGALLALLLAFVLLRGREAATGATPTATLAPPTPTVAPSFSSSTPTLVPTDQPEATAQPLATEPAAIQAVATGLAPTSVFAGALPIVLTVDGSNLNKVRAVRFVSSSGAVIPAEVQTRAIDQLKLNIPALPESISGEVNYALQIDGVVQKGMAITLRDYRERRPAQGVLAEYAYTGSVTADEAGAYAGLHAQADAGSATLGRLRNGDQIDLLRDDLADWYLVRINTSADPAQVGVVGWIQRWLIDNQGQPAPPTATPEPTPTVLVFAGRLYSTPTDAAAQCGAAFESSIYGSVENSNGAGIAGAVVRVTSADGRNSYTVRTARGGVYNVGGLGCTTWTVRLISVPGGKIQANPVTVRNLNGGRFTSAEVRYRLRK